VTRLDRRIWATALCIGLGSIFLYLLDDMRRVPARMADVSSPKAETNQIASPTGVEKQLRAQIAVLKRQLIIAQQQRATVHKNGAN
jgi:hypothetical protein